jgi:hypothetical protein
MNKIKKNKRVLKKSARKPVIKKKAVRPSRKKAGAQKVSLNRGPRYELNTSFEFFSELRALILKSSPAEKDKLIRKISKLGRVRLAVISGIFLNTDNTGYTPVADLFIVGDDINRKKLGSFLRSLEAEVGKEIKFGLMDKEEFEYRYGMFDRFVRVLLEGPHEKIINRMGL